MAVIQMSPESSSVLHPPEPIVTLEMIAAGVRNGEQAPAEDDDTSR